MVLVVRSDSLFFLFHENRNYSEHNNCLNQIMMCNLNALVFNKKYIIAYDPQNLLNVKPFYVFTFIFMENVG